MRVCVCFCAQRVWRRAIILTRGVDFPAQCTYHDRTRPFKQQLVNPWNNKPKLLGLAFIAKDKGFWSEWAGVVDEKL